MRHFINSPNKLLDHQTPRSLMQTEHGLSEVLRLLGTDATVHKNVFLFSTEAEK